MKSRKRVYAICEAAIMIAIALVLDYLKDILPGQLPSGGSVFNINILPIVFFGIRHGAGWGALTGLVFGGLTYLLGLNSMAIDWTTIICDYFLAFSLLGFGAGLFKGRKGAAYWGTLVGGTLQLLRRRVRLGHLHARGVPGPHHDQPLVLFVPLQYSLGGA